jgi:hypothetical protein
MIKMPNTKARFFSVKYSTRIQGALYTPSVCYPLSTGLQTTIEEMAAKDLAKIYPGKVRFVTGVPYPVKTPGTSAAVPQPSSAVVPETEAVVKPAVPEKPGRKSGRNRYGYVPDREFE